MPRLMSPAPASAEEIRDVNTRYHDGAAADYDAKWGIDFGEIGRTQVLGKLRKALDGRLRSFDRALELGAGTGYFSLNLLQAGGGVEGREHNEPPRVGEARPRS